jgi:hypothetical protein
MGSFAGDKGPVLGFYKYANEPAGREFLELPSVLFASWQGLRSTEFVSAFVLEIGMSWKTARLAQGPAQCMADGLT